jgi:hypothetical protein
MHRGVDPVEVEALSAPAPCVGQVSALHVSETRNAPTYFAFVV